MVRRARPGKTKRKTKYPLVECTHHSGDPLPGYVVCAHAMADRTVEIAPVERATRERVGTVLCLDCAAHPDLPVGRLVTACAHFVADNFGVPL